MQKDNKFSQEQKKYLLGLARRTLEHYFVTGEILSVEVREVDIELKEKRGTFVTLTKHGLLRGCIGHIEPVQEIYQDVIENALLSAFEDTRFPPLQEGELKEIEIEISVLSEPQELVYSGAGDLLSKLKPLEHGVIIGKSRHSATYLPQVWEDFESKEDFLSSLCEKAGLEAGEWKKGELKVEVYQTETFGEILNSPN